MLSLPGWRLASAHGFDERYDLPAPLAWFVAGAALTIALTFIVAIFFARSAAQADSQLASARSLRAGPALRLFGVTCRVAMLALFLSPSPPRCGALATR